MGNLELLISTHWSHLMSLLKPQILLFKTQKEPRHSSLPFSKAPSTPASLSWAGSHSQVISNSGTKRPLKRLPGGSGDAPCPWECRGVPVPGSLQAALPPQGSRACPELLAPHAPTWSSAAPGKLFYLHQLI